MYLKKMILLTNEDHHQKVPQADRESPMVSVIVVISLAGCGKDFCTELIQITMGRSISRVPNASALVVDGVPFCYTQPQRANPHIIFTYLTSGRVGGL